MIKLAPNAFASSMTASVTSRHNKAVVQNFPITDNQSRIIVTLLQSNRAKDSMTCMMFLIFILMLMLIRSYPQATQNRLSLY